MKHILKRLHKNKKGVVIGVLFLIAMVGLMQSGVGAAPILNPLNGHYYELVTTNITMTWAEAFSYAGSSEYNGWAGHLATLTSAQEDNWVLTNLGNPAAAWIGGFQNTGSASYSEPGGGWEWVTGEPWGYTNWQSGEPNEWKNNGENYLATNKDDGQSWNDRSIPALAYIVEYEPDPVATPEPATVALLASGLFGLAGLRRKKVL